MTMSEAEREEVGHLPALDVALGLVPAFPLADVLTRMLRLVHELVEHYHRLDDGPLKEAVAGHLAELRARGRRLEEVPSGSAALPPGYGGLEGDPAMRAQGLRAYVEPDLDAVLDGTARLLGRCLLASRLDRPDAKVASALLSRLTSTLYEELGQIPLGRGWYSLDPVVPGQSRFDPGRHRALSSARHEGLKGVVVELSRVGRRRIEDGALIFPAEVVVGE